MEPTTALKRGMKNIQDPADFSCYFQILEFKRAIFPTKFAD
jgi:hypothetical protein